MLKIIFVALLLSTSAIASDLTKVNLSNFAELKTVSIPNPNQDRIMLLLTNINNSSIDPLVTQVKKLAKTPKEPAYLVVDSHGGSLSAGQKFIDVMVGAKKTRGLKITCVVTHNALSMAAILVSYCHKTIMTPNSIMMFHEAAYGVEGPATRIRTYVAFTDKYLKGFERRLAKQLGITYEKYLEIRRDEFWLTADEAVELGFADALIDTFYYDIEPPKEAIFGIFFNNIFKGLINAKTK